MAETNFDGLNSKTTETIWSDTDGKLILERIGRIRILSAYYALYGSVKNKILASADRPSIPQRGVIVRNVIGQYATLGYIDVQTTGAMSCAKYDNYNSGTAQSYLGDGDRFEGQVMWIV